MNKPSKSKAAWIETPTKCVLVGEVDGLPSICVHDAHEFGTFDNVTGKCWGCGKTANQLEIGI